MAPISAPEMDLYPNSSAKPTVAMSPAPKTSPSPVAMSDTAMTAAGRRRPRPPDLVEPAAPLECAVARRRGGSVEVCANRMAEPTRQPTRHTTRPAPGQMVVVTMVASAGPPMKSTSSSAPSREKAVWMSRSECSRWDQRARVREPNGPVSEAMPAARSSSHSGPRFMAVQIASTVPAVKSASSGTMAARWPQRSTSWAEGMVCAAHTMMPTAATRPAIS